MVSCLAVYSHATVREIKIAGSEKFSVIDGSGTHRVNDWITEFFYHAV